MAEAATEVVTAEAATEALTAMVLTAEAAKERAAAAKERAAAAKEVVRAEAKEVVRAETMAVEVRSMQICLHCQQTPNSMFAFVGCDVVLHYPPVFDSSRN